MLHYKDVDLQPYEGISYYRLKQTDFDGSYSYSAPVSVSLDQNIPFKVSALPNPGLSENISLFISGIQGDVITMKIIDASGKNISTTKIQSDQASSMLQKLPDWPSSSGVYTVIVSDGYQQAQVKVILL